MNKFVAIVGMSGAGKTTTSLYLKEKGFAYIRFGQITIDKLKKQGLPINEANERKIREALRKKHGMAAYAILNLKKFKNDLEKGHVAGDGLISWAEYQFLKDKFGDGLIILAIYASPKTRYHRLKIRKLNKIDQKAFYRRYTTKEARSRDISMITNSQKGGPIAMADWTIVNEGSVEEFHKGIENFLRRFDLVVENSYSKNF